MIESSMAYVGRSASGCRALEGGDQLIFDKELRVMSLPSSFMKYVLRQPRMTKKSFVATSPPQADGPRSNFPKGDSPHQLLEIFAVERKTLNICFLYSGIMRMKSNFLPYGLR